MTHELETLKFRRTVPKDHRTNLDTRLAWLWRQRFGTVQNIYQQSKDVLDQMACTIILQCIIGRDVTSIQQLFNRLEGRPLSDVEVEKQRIVTPPESIAL